MAGMINSGVSGLMAYQRAIDVASQNIANANTDGYVRQRVELATQGVGADRRGSSVGGVKVEEVRRLVNEFLIEQSRTANAGAGRAETMAAQAERLAALLGSTSFGIDDALQRLKNAFEGLAVEPASLRARDALLNELQSTVDRFTTIDDRIRQFDREINGRIAQEVDDVNTLLGQVAAVNDKIFRLSIATGVVSSLAFDERDRVLDKLSSHLGFKVAVELDGTTTVKTLDDRLLVRRSESATLTVVAGLYDTADTRILLQPLNGAATTELGSGVAGGSIGGLIDARTQINAPIRNHLGRIAIGLAQVLNMQNAAGLNLDGVSPASTTPATALLAVGAPVAFAASTNTGTGTISATVNNVADLTHADYLVTRTNVGGNGGWSVTSTDGSAVSVTGTGPLMFDGLTVTVPVGAASGDSFLLRPTQSAVAGSGGISFELATHDPRAIAAAANEFPFGAGDNRNALALSGKLVSGLLDGGTASAIDAAARLANRVGAQARSSQLSADVQRLAVDETGRQRADMYGVNLDEEAASLIRYQQAYQAAASVIRVANELFDEILGATR